MLNGTMKVKTIGVSTKPDCSNPTSQSIVGTTGSNFNLSATSITGCSYSAVFDPDVRASILIALESLQLFPLGSNTAVWRRSNTVPRCRWEGGPRSPVPTGHVLVSIQLHAFRYLAK
jgi:hypothetical protein